MSQNKKTFTLDDLELDQVVETVMAIGSSYVKPKRVLSCLVSMVGLTYMNYTPMI